MTIKLYAIMGQLAHEKSPIYTDSDALTKEQRDLAYTVTVDIPDNYPLSYNAAGDTLIDIDGVTYLLSEVLSTYDGKPCLKWYDGTRAHRLILK